MSIVESNVTQADFEKTINELQITLDSYIPELNNMGMSVENSITNTDNSGVLARRASAEQITVRVYWWGVDIVMNEKLTQDIISGITGAGAVGGLIASALGAAGVVTGGIATVIGAGVAAIVAVKIAQINMANNGKGVHWPITWLQWGALLVAVPTGPAGILAAGAAFIHPLRNN